jgi:hypothetical protein
MADLTGECSGAELLRTDRVVVVQRMVALQVCSGAELLRSDRVSKIRHDSGYGINH